MLSRKFMITLLVALGLSSSLSAMAAKAAATASSAPPVASATAATALVNVNTGDLQALETIKGLGPSKAQAIVDYRNKNGHFQTIQDLAKVPGIGPKLLAKIQPQISV